MSICTGCFMYDKNIKNTYGKNLCKECNKDIGSKITMVKDHWKNMEKKYKKIGKTYLYEKTEDPLVAYERLCQKDENGNKLWEEELDNIVQRIEAYEAKQYYDSIEVENFDDQDIYDSEYED